MLYKHLSVWLTEMKSYFPEASLTSSFSLCPFLVQSWDKESTGLLILQGRVQGGTATVLPLAFRGTYGWRKP